MVKYTNPPAYRVGSCFLIAICSFTFCFLGDPNKSEAKQTSTQSSPITSPKLRKCCKQTFSKKNKKNNQLDYLDKQITNQIEPSKVEICRKRTNQDNQTSGSSPGTMLNHPFPDPIETTADGDKKNEVVLDEYEKIKNFYAYDPICQKWLAIKCFKIIKECINNKQTDRKICIKSYEKFWAYDSLNQTWQKVTLIPYLQQTNTQINNDSPPIAIKESPLSDQNNQFNDLATDELLEELLGVHTLAKPTNSEPKETSWANLSFDFSLGTGAVFYTNRLDGMSLLQKRPNEYFFKTKTKTGTIYQDNWFHDTLVIVQGLDLADPTIKEASTEHPTFKGKGWAIPLTLGIQYTFWKRLLLGFGREVVFNFTRKLVHNGQAIDHKEYILDKQCSTQSRWFFKCGWYPFFNEKNRFFTDIRLFHIHHLDTVLPNLLRFRDYVHQALASNLGLGYEQQVSNYVALTTRLAIEWQQFKQFTKEQPRFYNIHYKQPAFYLQLALNIRCAKYNSSNDLKNKTYQNQYDKSSDSSKLEGLENLLDLD